MVLMSGHNIYFIVVVGRGRKLPLSYPYYASYSGALISDCVSQVWKVCISSLEGFSYI